MSELRGIYILLDKMLEIKKSGQYTTINPPVFDFGPDTNQILESIYKHGVYTFQKYVNHSGKSGLTRLIGVEIFGTTVYIKPV